MECKLKDGIRKNEHATEKRIESPRTRRWNKTNETEHLMIEYRNKTYLVQVILNIVIEYTSHVGLEERIKI